MSVNEVLDVVRLLVPKVNTHSCETVSTMGDDVPQDLGLLKLIIFWRGVRCQITDPVALTQSADAEARNFA